MCVYRQIGFGSIGYIPLTEVATWAAINDVDDVPDLAACVRAMDAAYIDEWAEKQKREADARKRSQG